MSNLFSEKDVVLDLEIYPNFVLFAFKHLSTGRLITIDLRGPEETLSKEQRKKLSGLMTKYRTFGFNSMNFDLPIIIYALAGADVQSISKLADKIIKENLSHYRTMQFIDETVPSTFDHFDVSEPAPGVRISLKLYGGRMHSKRLQDLPIEPGTWLNEAQMQEIIDYCENDLDTTIELYQTIYEEMEIRDDMGKEYRLNLMSKSDAQVAEGVILTTIERKLGKKIFKPKTTPDFVTYNIPDFIRFQTPELQGLLNIIRKQRFELDGTGNIKIPKDIAAYKIEMNGTKYKIGVGGLHSQESGQVVIADKSKGEILADRDVTSYYPYIILNLGLYPKHIGPMFLQVYRSIVEERVRAKGLISQYGKELKLIGDETDPRYIEKKKAQTTQTKKAGMLKICVNGSFGKLGSKYSKLYSPDLMLAVTLTGQLSLLMLIEALELHGIHVVSANTDGFVSLIPKGKYEIYDLLCFDWQVATGFNLEETRYNGLYSRDVNNYFAHTEDGKVKGKGVFTKAGVMKNPAMDIVSKAVQEYMVNDVPFIETLKACKEVSPFLNVRSVTGGAVWRGEYLGRVVRWLYTSNGESIHYQKNGNKVPKSDGAMPVQDLPDNLPKNLDYDRYVAECQDLYESVIGVKKNTTTRKKKTDEV